MDLAGVAGWGRGLADDVEAGAGAVDAGARSPRLSGRLP
jgi:uncharacterized protein